MNRLTRRCFFAFISFLLYYSLSAQHVKQFSFKHFSNADGLAANEIRCTVQDKQGFLWLGTANGLQRFDGTRFITFRHSADNPVSLPANAVQQLLIDRQNNMWLMFDNGKAGTFDTRTLSFREAAVNVTNQLYLRADKEMFYGLDGHIIYLFKGAEALVYNAGIHAFVSSASIIPTPRGWKINSFAADTLLRKYWISGDSGIAVFNPSTKHLSYPGHNTDHEPVITQHGSLSYVLYLFIDSKRRLWFERWPPSAGEPALYSCNIVTGAPVLYHYSFGAALNQYHELRNILEQKNGSLWIRGAAVFAQFNEVEKNFILVQNGYINEQSIYYDIVNNLYEDREQNIWIATSNNGLYLFNPYNQPFTVIKHLNPARNGTGKGGVLSFTYTNSGTILSSAWSDGIFQYDSSFNSVPVAINGIAEKNTHSVWGMCRLKDNRTIWMSMQPGIMIYDQLTNSAKLYNPPVLENRTVRQVMEDRQGNMWLGVQNRGIYKWVRSKAVAGFEQGLIKLNNIPKTNINKIISDSEGYIWVCTHIDGIYKINPVNDSVMEHFSSSGPPGRRLLDNICTSVMEYNDSLMMIAAGGLNIYNIRNHTIRHITVEDGLPSDVIESMEKDNNGNLWLAMVNGLCRFNLPRKKFTYYNRTDGLINDQFVLAASCHLPDGRLLFGTIEDFIVFDPARVTTASAPPDVVITDIKMTDSALPLDSLLKLPKIELPYYHNSVFIEFAGLSYQGKNKIDYYYMLEGLDKEWKKADALNRAAYSYLPPNNYTFKVKMETGEGVESRHVTTLRIKIKPPFWRTWWFVSLLAFAALSLFLYLDRLRVLRLRSTIRMRNKIAGNFTKDLSSTLGTINVLSEMAKVKADRDSERTKEYVSQISDNSSRMMEVMDDMIWSIKPENDELQYTLARMTNFAADLHAKFDIEIHFDLGEKVQELKLPMDQRHELYIIFKEALMNAARHSQSRYAEVAITCHKSRLRLRIQDEGKGFDTENLSFGRGLNDMQKKASGLNAQLTIHSEINTGTIVQLDMPVK